MNKPELEQSKFQKISGKIAKISLWIWLGTIIIFVFYIIYGQNINYSKPIAGGLFVGNIGLGILAFTQSTGIVKPFYWFAAIVAILAGFVEIKDYFWYGRWFSLQMVPGGTEKIKKISNTMKSMEVKHPLLSLGIAALLGFVVVLFEFPCTGAPYLAILALLSAGDYSSGVPLLLLYNLIFILPLFVIIGLVYFGSASNTLEKWRKEHRGLMRLCIGLFLLALGAYLIYTALHL